MATRTRRPWVLLHGSDGHETDLLPLAARLAPSAAKIAPRGSVVMPGGFGHVLRRHDGTIDEDDLLCRVDPLARLVGASLAEHGLDRSPTVMGFSSGAIMAAALLTLRSDLFGAAVLLRPLTPFTDRPIAPLDSVPVLVIDAAEDERRSAGDGARQAEVLARAGARVTHSTLDTGHPLSDDDTHAIRDWLDSLDLA